MKIINKGWKGDWREVANLARNTIGLEDKEGNVKDSWKKKILLSEHSPIRSITFKWQWIDLPYYVSVHFVRHKVGIEHFVKTSRTDRTGVDRNKLPQNNPVNHTCEANLQALINISRKRLCFQASKETREAWKVVVKEVRKEEPLVAEVMVPECVYRGFCPEMKPCGWFDNLEGSEFDNVMDTYRRRKV